MKFLALLLLASCSACPPVDVNRVAGCKSLYDSCVDTSETREEYLECRNEVDARCLNNEDE